MDDVVALTDAAVPQPGLIGSYEITDARANYFGTPILNGESRGLRNSSEPKFKLRQPSAAAPRHLPI